MIIFIIAAALGLRLALTLSHPGYLGVDGGAYLVGMAATMGDERIIGFPRPPLAPGFILWPFVELLGTDIGYKVWSSLASLSPLIPVYLFCRRIPFPRHRDLIMAVTVAILSLDLLHGEMIVTGSLPLLAFGFLGTAWWAMGRLAEERTLRLTLILAGSLAFIPYINQTTAGLAIVTVPVYLIALRWAHRDNDPIRGNLPGLALGGLLALTALPWYLEVLPVTGMPRFRFGVVAIPTRLARGAVCSP